MKFEQTGKNQGILSVRKSGNHDDVFRPRECDKGIVLKENDIIISFSVQTKQKRILLGNAYEADFQRENSFRFFVFDFARCEHDLNVTTVCPQRERLLLDTNRAPETAEDFDRLVLQSPNSSIVWMRYMAFFLETAEVEKAKAVAERALRTISFR